MKAKSFLTNLAIALLTIFLMVGCLEGGARIILGIQPQPDRFILSPQLGWEWTPGYDRTEHYKGVDFRMTASEQGLRNEWVTIPKPDNTFRIIALGDSVVASPGVETADTFVKQLERKLQADNSSRTIEVINAGTDDYGSEQERIWLQERGLAFDPDLLILHIYLNDSRSFSAPSTTVAAFSNFFNQHSAIYTIYRNALLTQMAASSEQQIDFRFRYKEALAKGDWQHDSQALTHLIQAADKDWGLAWYEEALIHIEEEVIAITEIAQNQGFPVMLVLIPVNVQVQAEVDTRLDLTGPQYELVNFAQFHGIPVVDLLPILIPYKDEDIYFDQVHLKTMAHEPVAEAIYQALYDFHLLGGIQK